MVYGWDPTAHPLKEDSLLHSLDSAVFKMYFINDDEGMKVKVLLLRRVRLFVTLWTVAARLLCP